MRKGSLKATEELEPDAEGEDEILCSQYTSAELVERINDFQNKLKRDGEVAPRLEVFQKLTAVAFAVKIAQLEEWAFALTDNEEKETDKRGVTTRVTDALNVMESLRKQEGGQDAPMHNSDGPSRHRNQQ